MRIGFGYDVHQLVEGRKLILGGIEIPYEKGLLGHSDADVCIHAIMDSILGALALGDIGQIFPDTDMQYKDIDSKILLEKVTQIMMDNGYRMGNIDVTIACKIIEHAENIIQGVAETGIGSSYGIQFLQDRHNHLIVNCLIDFPEWFLILNQR